MFVRLLLLSLVLTLPGGALAQNSIPRTTEGRPDFGGVWENQFRTTLQRPASASGLVIDQLEGEKLIAEEAQAMTPAARLNLTYGYVPPTSWARIRGEYRSSMITQPADGQLPLTPSGRSVLSSAPPQTFDSYEQRPGPERCFGSPGLAPMLVAPENNYRHFVQTPGFLVIHTEQFNTARTVAFGGLTPPDAMRSREGYSIGRWEGDTLVVETAHLDGKIPRRAVNRSALPIGPGSRIVERFSFVTRDELLYQFTVEDPQLYSAPWSAEYPMFRSNAEMFEFACHEGNYSLPHVLQGARIVEERAAKVKR